MHSMGWDASPALWLSLAELAPTGHAHQVGEYWNPATRYLIRIMSLQCKSTFFDIGKGAAVAYLWTRSGSAGGGVKRRMYATRLRVAGVQCPFAALASVGL